MVGKLPHELLVAKVFRRIGVRDPDVIVGPGVAIDAAIIRVGSEYLVVHTDPITEAIERAGWLAIHVASNDVAVSGAKPRWASVAILLPPGKASLLDIIVEDIDKAARELGIMVVGGHTEEAPGATKPVIAATVMGVTKRPLSISNVREGLEVIVAKYVGAEGTAIIASDFANLLREKGVDEKTLETAREFFNHISVVKEALAIADIVEAMHDPTEGGLLGALYEVAFATNTVIELWVDKVPVHDITRRVCSLLGIEPLKLISSGALLAFVKSNIVDEVLARLRKIGVPAAHVGRIVGKGKGRVKLVLDGKTIGVVDRFVVDELARLWEKHGELNQ